MKGLFWVGGPLLGAALLFFLVSTDQKDRELSRRDDPDQRVEDLVACEEWIELMSSNLNRIFSEARSWPVAEASEQFGWLDGGRDLVEGYPRFQSEPGGLERKIFHFSEGEGGGASWDFVEGSLVKVDSVKVGFLSGSFGEQTRDFFRAKVALSVKGETADGRKAGLTSEQIVSWKLVEGGMVPSASNDYLIEPNEWEVLDWRLQKAEILMSGGPLFSEVTDQLVTGERDREKISQTDHSRYLETLFSGGKIPLKTGYGRYFTTDATAQHPGISVVDINGDGRDDLYLCVRWGRNLLFRDRGDGTFEEVAGEYGLDVPGLSSSAIFADFDNDGDQDVFIGRTLERSLYLKNEGGFFRDCSADHVSSELPYFTTSMTAADFNGDGLLDLYFSTYGFAIRQPRDRVARDFLPEYPADEVARRFVNPPNVEPYLNLPGPPNVLLENTGGGRFKVSPLSSQLASWRETLQATWADYDLDGDPDLYVCNDFAPDQLFRNEDGKCFVDVTGSEGHERMRGFGMGASFGDFDNDLDLDLYVSNMFSKAGLRIIDKVGLRDPRFRWSAEGNLLFANEGKTGFEFVSEAGSAFGPVTRADWSWGGQFVDFDQDGFLDLYVPNGYFSAPSKFAAEADL